MSALVVLGLVLALFIVLHLLGWKGAETVGRKPRILLGVLTLLPCLPGLWFAFYYLHFLPEPPLLYQLRSLAFSEGFLSLFGLACGVWRSLLPKLLKPLPTAAGVFLLAIPFLKPVLHKLDTSSLRDEWRDGACIQTSVVTCGPAAAASILRELGDTEVTERDLAEEAWTSDSGTEAWHLARALRRRGYRVRFLAPKGLPDPLDLPGIMGTGSIRAGHFIAVLELGNGEIRYMDPLRGRVHTDLADFHRWNETEPFFMSIQPGPEIGP
ncbi:cysteine peptidase family C39 domain-containing protein [Luteolibacter marinus]|uniref:cysteine peptidase family C39 domain-containing protein n=1 Tax=Luteolibacter marinus TaxID=2776705 RepID=UPI00186868E1|nr:cysteine peptidase family C39 domain-containing protein [Luteolibacter marinus]